jgi:hypothetical protein
MLGPYSMLSEVVTQGCHFVFNFLCSPPQIPAAAAPKVCFQTWDRKGETVGSLRTILCLPGRPVATPPAPTGGLRFNSDQGRINAREPAQCWAASMLYALDPVGVSH